MGALFSPVASVFVFGGNGGLSDDRRGISFFLRWISFFPLRVGSAQDVRSADVGPPGGEGRKAGFFGPDDE